jgi:predicted aspartyl protease
MHFAKSTLLPLALALSFLTTEPACHAADPPAQFTQLPLEVYGGYLLVVEGNIGARHGLKFLLDTGATHTTLDRSLAQAIDAPTRKVKILNGDRVVAIDEITLPELSLGPIQARNLDVTVADLRYLQASGVSVDAIVGLDILSRRNFLLDLAQKRVTFGGVAPLLPHSAALRVDPFSVQVQIEVDGHPAWMIADTGTPAILFFEDRLAALRVSYRTTGRIIGTTFSGSGDSQIAYVPHLRVSNQNLAPRAYLSATPKTTFVANTAGYFGVACLHARRIAFDFEKRELRWAE